MSEHIRTKITEHIAHIQIHRPEKINALTQQIYAGLREAILAAEADPAVRVLLLYGTPGCFSAGNDLKDFVEFSQTHRSGPVAGEAVGFLSAISQAAKPIVAAVAGPAIGIGTTLLLHCDLVVAAESTLFQLPFVNLGVCAEGASSLLLPAMAGYQRAAELLLLGERFPVSVAYEIGLVNRVCPAGEELELATELATELAQRPPRSVCATKALMRRSLSQQVTETMEEEFRRFGELLVSPEAKEAFTAFFERRHPDFSKFD